MAETFESRSQNFFTLSEQEKFIIQKKGIKPGTGYYREVTEHTICIVYVSKLGSELVRGTYACEDGNKPNTASRIAKSLGISISYWTRNNLATPIYECLSEIKNTRLKKKG